MLVQIPKYQRTYLPILLNRYLMRGKVTTAYTGRQSAGKTTAMIASIADVDPRLTIRTLETAFEMYLREIYTGRNIYSVAETVWVDMVALQDALKKSDAALTIIGEVSSDKLASRMISAGMVASMFTIFSHHAITTQALVYSLRNSLMVEGHYGNEMIAESQVLQVVKMDVHLDFDVNGDRIVERFTQIVPLAENVDYPAYDPNDPVNSMNRATLEYYKRQTDRKTFDVRDIIVFNRKTMSYEPANWFTPELTKHMISSMEDEDKEAFYKFQHDNWGVA